MVNDEKQGGKRVDECNYLGSSVKSNGVCGTKVKKLKQQNGENGE